VRKQAVVFNESLHRWKARLISSRNPGDGMLLSALFQPAPPAHAPTDSLTVWIWLGIALALLVAGGVVLASRR